MPKKEMQAMSTDTVEAFAATGLLTAKTEVLKYIASAGNLWAQINAYTNPTVDENVFATAYNAASKLREIRLQVTDAAGYNATTDPVNQPKHFDNALTYLNTIRTAEKNYSSQIKSAVYGICSGYETFIVAMTGMKTRDFLEDIGMVSADWRSLSDAGVSFRELWYAANKEELKVPLATITCTDGTWGEPLVLGSVMNKCNLEIKVTSYGGTPINLTRYSLVTSLVPQPPVSTTVTVALDEEGARYSLGNTLAYSAGLTLSGGSNDVIEIWTR